MIGLICLIVFALVWFGIEQWLKTRNKNGSHLKNRTKPYFDKIKELLSLCQGTYFEERIILNSQQLLKDLENEYNGFLQQGTLRENDLCKLVIENYNNQFFVECFALIYVYSYKPCDILSPSDIENFARKAIKDYCRNKILKYGEDFPRILLTWFNVDIDKFQSIY